MNKLTGLMRFDIDASATELCKTDTHENLSGFKLNWDDMKKKNIHVDIIQLISGAHTSTTLVFFCLLYISR
jgi:hypothetical protein